MAEQTSDSTYRISGLYVTPNWNGNSDRVAMSCGIGATIKVLRKVDVVISADPGATLPKTWNMTARNTILRTTNKVYLYARVERNGANGMYIWSENFYDVTGVAGDKVAVNNEQYYYIRVGELGTDRVTLNLDYGKYGVNEDGTETETPEYNWNDFWKWDAVNKVIVFLQAIGALVMKSIVLAGKELNQVLTSQDDENADYASSDNAVVTGGFLNRWVNKIKGMFIRKDIADGTDHPLHAGEIIAKRSNAEGSNGIVRTERFSATSGAMDGYGAGMWMLEDGTGIMETDLFYVRRAAYFRSLTIAEVKHMGGEVILSAAACQIAYVVPLGGTPMNPKPVEELATPKFYRCFFEKQANGRKVYNEWMKDDQSRCQRFDADGNKVEGSFYWRLVVGVGEDEDFYYVDLSFADCATGSNAPKSNDNIVLFGHRNPTASTYDRTCAQVYSTVGIHAPSRAYYSGITSYDLSQAQRPEYLERDAQGNVEWYVGGFDDNSGKEHYIKYNTRTGLDIRTNSMTVIADGKDVSVGEALGDNFQFITFSDKAPTENGEVAKWIPADDIDPSDGWSLEEKDAHVGDYLITSDGFTYEFVRDDSGSIVSHGWQISSDEYLINAQKDATSAITRLNSIDDDQIVSVSEKIEIYRQLKTLLVDIQYYVTRLQRVKVNPYDYKRAAGLLVAMLQKLLLEPNEDTPLYIEGRGELCATDNGGGEYVCDYREAYRKGTDYTYAECLELYSLTVAQSDDVIDAGIDAKVTSMVVAKADEITAQAITDIRNLDEKFAGHDGVIQNLKEGVAALGARMETTDSKGNKVTSFSGLVARADYASLFSTYLDEDGNPISDAFATVYHTLDEHGEVYSGFDVRADVISIAAGYSMQFFTGELVIESDGFKLDKDGNATFSGELKAATGTFGGKVSSEHGNSKFEIDPTLQSLSMKVALEYTESGEEVSTSQQVEIFELGTMQGTGSGTAGNMKYQRVAYVTCRSYNSLGQLYHVASIDGTDGFRSRYYDSSLNVTSEVDVSAQGVLLKGNAILAVENIATIDKDDADHRKYLLPGQVYRVKGEHTLKINV